MTHFLEILSSSIFSFSFGGILDFGLCQLTSLQLIQYLLYHVTGYKKLINTKLIPNFFLFFKQSEVYKVDSWWRWLFWHCSYCMCKCDAPGPNSDRYWYVFVLKVFTTIIKRLKQNLYNKNYTRAQMFKFKPVLLSVSLKKVITYYYHFHLE